MLSRLLSLAASFAALALAANGFASLFQPHVASAGIEAVSKLLQQKKVDRDAVAKKAAAIKAKHDDLNDLMGVFKPTKSGGIGWYPARKGPGDGIERRIFDLATKKELTKAQLAAEKALVVRSAYFNLAMHEIVKGYAPATTVAGKGLADWNKHNGEMKDGSLEAIAAVKANDPAALKKAMRRVAIGCNACHTMFRSLDATLEALAESMRAPKADRANVELTVATLHAAYSLEELMKKAYKPTQSGGIGWNPARKGPGDGIEKRINDLATKKELTKVELTKERDLIHRTAAYNRAMHELTKAFAPTKVVAGKGPKQWKQHNDEMDAGTKEVMDAVKANDTKALKKAMGRVAAGCNGCHKDFR